MKAFWKKHRLKVLGVLAVLFLVGSVQAYFVWRGDPELDAMKEMRTQLRNDKLTREERQEIRQKLDEAYQNLPEDKKKAFATEAFDEREKEMMERERKETHRVEEFYKLSKEEQTKELDKEIDKWEERRARFQARREAGGSGGMVEGGGPPPAWAGGGWGGGPGRRGNGEAGNPPAGDGANRPPISEEERELRQKKRIDNTTAEQRAMRTQYMRELDARRVERGMPSLKEMRRPGGGFGGMGGFFGGR